MSILGKHLLLDLKRCDREPLDNLDFLKETLAFVAQQSGASILSQSFHQFQPQGVSGIVMINGAHLCIHTWPEYNYAAIDVFTYGDQIDPEEAARLLIEKLGAKDPSVVELKRGL